MMNLARKQLPRWSITLILLGGAGILCIIFVFGSEPLPESTTPDGDTMQHDTVEETTHPLPETDLEPSSNGLSKAELDLLREESVITDEEKRSIEQLEEELRKAK